MENTPLNPEITEDFDVLLDRLAGRRGGAESNVQISRGSDGRWSFCYDGDTRGPFDANKLEAEIDAYCS